MYALCRNCTRCCVLACTAEGSFVFTRWCQYALPSHTWVVGLQSAYRKRCSRVLRTHYPCSRAVNTARVHGWSEYALYTREQSTVRVQFVVYDKKLCDLATYKTMSCRIEHVWNDPSVRGTVKARLHDTTGCQTGCCQTGCTTGLTTGRTTGCIL